MSIFQKKIFDNPSIFSSYVNETAKNYRKRNSPLAKNLQHVFKTCKKGVIFLLIFNKLQKKLFSFFNKL